MAAHDPDRGKPLRAVLMDWAEDNPGTVTGMVTGFVFAAVCTAATAGVGLVACGVMGGAISSAIGSSIDYVDQTPASERNWGDYFQQVGVDTAIGAALGLAGEGLGVLVQGAAKPLLSSASRALSDVVTGGVASGTDDVARVTVRSTWDDVAAGVTTTWNAKVPFKPRVNSEAPTTGTGSAATVATANTVSVFRSGGAAAEGGGISLEQAASAASRNGIDMRMMQLAQEAGGPGYGFTSYTISGAPFRAANGRFVVTLTDRGLATEADAVNTIAHELNHLREAMRTGTSIVEEGPAIRSGYLAEEFLR